MEKGNALTLSTTEEVNNSNSSNQSQGRIIEDYGIFKIVDGEKGFFIALGRHRVSAIYKNKKEVINLLNRFKPEEWEFLATTILALIEEVKKFDNQ